MCYFVVADQVKGGILNVMWYPGKEKLEYSSLKHHTGSHHKSVRPWYINVPKSVHLLPRAQTPNTLRGCAGTLDHGYVPKISTPSDGPLNGAEYHDKLIGTTC